MAKKSSLKETTVVTPLMVYRNAKPVKINRSRLKNAIVKPYDFNYEVVLVKSPFEKSFIFVARRVVFQVKPKKLIENTVRVFKANRRKDMNAFVSEAVHFFDSCPLQVLTFDGSEKNCKEVEKLILSWKQTL